MAVTSKKKLGVTLSLNCIVTVLFKVSYLQCDQDIFDIVSGQYKHDIHSKVAEHGIHFQLSTLNYRIFKLVEFDHENMDLIKAKRNDVNTKAEAISFALRETVESIIKE